MSSTEFDESDGSITEDAVRDGGLVERGKPYQYFGEWESDADAECCRRCEKRFGAIVRRHHCRACGKIFCSKCANSTRSLPFYSTPQRVCLICIDEWAKIDEVALVNETTPLFEYAPGIYLKEFFVGFYGAQIRTRMVVVVLQSIAEPEEGDAFPAGSMFNLLVYSPTPVLDDATMAQLARLGKVRFVLEPNKLHNQGLLAFKKAYPTALYYAPPGLAERMPEFAFQEQLTDEVPVEWEVELDQCITKGNIFNPEVLLYHRMSKTIIVGDLVETFDSNITRGSSTVAKAVAWFYSVKRGGYTASPEFIHYTQDIESASLTREYIMDQWSDAERMVTMHGKNVDERPLDVLNEVYEDLFHKVRSHWNITNWMNRGLAKVQ